jgi:cytochrome oxidase Cu insertion factor (SCO1/SenC/PrrC family)
MRKVQPAALAWRVRKVGRSIPPMIWRGRTHTGLGLFVAALMLLTGCTVSDSRATIDIDDLGPQVGERVPDFTLPDQRGRSTDLESILGPNGAILMFYRSADW